MKNKPLVSIIMPLFNSEKYLDAAIKSVLAQTYKNFELIIVDDASTDSSLQIAKKYKSQDKRIKLLRLKQNRNCGGDKCANVGLSYAKGEYVARMDADDIADPKRIEKQIEYLDSHPSVFLVGSEAYVIDSEGVRIGEKVEPHASKDIYNLYFGFHPMIHPTCTFRRLLKNGEPFKYQIKYSANNDYYTFYRLICEGYKFINLPEKLLDYRIHNHNATFVDMKKKFKNSVKIRLSMVIEYGYKPSARDLITLMLQTLVVMSLPERVVKEVYFFAKGIKKFRLPRLSLRPAFSFGKAI